MEWFWIGGMARVGPEAFGYGDEYEFSVGFKIPPWQFVRRLFGFKAWAVLTGTHAPKDGITQAYKTATQAALAHQGYAVYWERHKNGKVKIIMAKESLHKKMGSTAPDGKLKLDGATVGGIATEYAKKIVDGTFKVEGISEIDLGGNKYARTFVIQE